MRILHALRSPYSQIRQNFIPDPTIMKGPPLPTAILATETVDNRCATWMGGGVVRAVEHDGIYYDDCEWEGRKNQLMLCEV